MKEYKVAVTIPWWVTYIYLPTLVNFTRFCQNYIDREIEPDYNKVSEFINKNIKVKNV